MLTIGLFLLSLEDVYISQISGAPFPVLGLLILFASCRNFHRWGRLEIAYLLVVGIGFAVGLYRLTIDPIVQSPLEQVFPTLGHAIEVKATNLIGWVASFLALVMSMKTRAGGIIVAIRIFLFVHVGFFVVQSIVFYASHHYIDPFALFGQSSRVFGGSLTEEISVLGIRPAGFFREPSNYAVHVIPVALVYHILARHLSWLTIFALASTVLTFSSWAFVGLALSVLVITRPSVRTIAASVVLALTLSTFFDWFVARTFQVKYDEARKTPWELRAEFARSVVGSALELSPGLGAGIADPNLQGYAINDSGALIYFFYVFGCFSPLLLLALLTSIPGAKPRLVLLLLLSSKLFPTYPFFWVIINLLRYHTEPETVVAPLEEEVLSKADNRTRALPAA